ncbi:hypothetical protein [Bacillus rubiinfantis]|uniref:hypothetical protein n=1 Tax=Bacillus rubiinfantis TaxID=1499680 RepID=UPI0005AB8D54|nr:hypothetical protein [Bacillus rubiinfantis]
MGLKAAVFELKESITRKQIGNAEADFILKLETEFKLRSGTLAFYYNFLMMMDIRNQKNASSSNVDGKKVNRKWTKDEIAFMFHYISERQEEGGLNITELLDEVARLLGRGYQSVNYKYYSLIKTQETKNVEPPQITTISKERIPVLSTEVLHDLPSQEANHLLSSEENEDLLDILSGLITNVEKLPGIKLDELLKSLYHLTNLALQNQNVAIEIETMKSKMSAEKETYRDKVRKLEQQVQQEKNRNDELQQEVSKLAKEIMAFNQLGDAAKIQQLKAYNQRLNYIIDGFGVVLQVGS